MLGNYFSGEVEDLGGKGDVERWPGGMGRQLNVSAEEDH